MKDWEVKSSKYLIDNPWIKVRKDDIQIKDEVLDYYVVEERDGVVVVALTEKKEIVLINQYKIGVSENALSLPSGYYEEKHGGYEYTAASELQEEAGFKAKRFKKIGSFYRAPGRHTQKVHVFLAEKLSPVKRKLEVDEEGIEVKLIKFGKVIEMIKSNDIKDMETIASVLMVKEFLGK
jgi:ADP-ribose pyrophosphatase